MTEQTDTKASYSPPDAVRNNARRGLELREKWGRGGLSTQEAGEQGIGSGVARASNLANGDGVSLATVRRMAAFFSRHEGNYKPDKKEDDGGPTAGTIAYLLWGGAAGRRWAEGILNDMDENEKAISLDKQLQAIHQTFYRLYSGMGAGGAMDCECWVVETYDTHIIARMSEKYYRVPYTVEGEGVTFAPAAEWQMVEEKREWVDVVKALKAGARNSASDAARLQAIHDLAVENGAVCVAAEPATMDSMNTLKAVSETDDELRVANYIVLFNRRDLEGIGSSRVNPDGTTGEQFAPDVDLDSDYTKAGVLYVDWEHGADPEKTGSDEHNILGFVDWKTAKRDEQGVFVERVLNRRNQYVKWLEPLIREGIVGNSSEAVPGKVKKTQDGRITRWPLKRDSLTVTPMQPEMITENQLSALKALGLIKDKPSVTPGTTTAEAAPEAANHAAAGEPEDAPEPLTSTLSVEKKAMELTEEKLSEMIASASAAAATKAVEEMKKAAPATSTAGVVVTHDEADNLFESIAEQCKAVKAWETSKGGVKDPRLSRLGQKALGASEGVAADGGFLLEPTLQAEILKPMHEEGPFTRGVRRLPVGNNSNYGWLNGVDETSRATGSRWGGIQGYRLAEAGTKTGSRPKFRRISWELKKYAVLCYATDELLADAAQFSAVVRMGAGEELNFMANDDIINGAGVGGPLGFLNSGAVIAVAKEAGQAAATINNVNLMKMWARVHARSKMNAAWYYNTDCGPQLHQMAMQVGTSALEPRFVTYAPDGSLRIYGRPAIETEFNATVGALGDIVVADLSEYLFWDKDGVQEASSIHVQFLTDETVFRFVYRCDGQPSIASPLTPYKGSNTVSPFVGLAARA